MVTLMYSSHFTISHQPISRMSSSNLFPIFVVISPPKFEHQLIRFKSRKVKQRKQSLQFLELVDCSGVVTMCRKWESEDSDSALEMEVLEFMKKSKNPAKFPTKKELFEAGRLDLVDAIRSRGGWMSLGWEDEEVKDGNVHFGIEKYGENGSEGEGRSGAQLNEGSNEQDYSFLGNSLEAAASSSGRSLESEAEDESGIEGILHRLERQRNLILGINLRKNGNLNHVPRNFDESDRRAGTSKDADSCHPEGSETASSGRDRSMFSDNGSTRSHSSTLKSSLEANNWRNWSIQRAGYSEKEFEAAEIDFGGTASRRSVDYSVGETTEVQSTAKGGSDETKCLDSFVRDIGQGDVKSHLRHLQLELSRALLSLRSSTTDLSEKAEGHSSEDLRELSDASEFQENEVMYAHNKLRSIRAQLAVLEGKTALAIIDAQKILDEKQKRIDDARQALQLLRSVCIVWPNSGSEVTLLGSFDGWATERKMERSTAGIFSLNLKLYPGRYEIKFIVDGVWMVDPLRPIVNNGGFENNLLIIN